MTATLVVVVLAASACDHTIVDPSAEAPAFEANSLTMNSAPEHVVKDTTISIRMVATPLYSGKGRFALNPVGGELTAYVQAPIQDTIHGSDPPIFVPVEFTADETKEVVWEVRFEGAIVESGFTWGVEGTAAMDSIRVDTALYEVHSEKARELAGRRLKATVYERLLYGN